MRSRPISAAGMTLLNNRTLLHQPVAGEISARSEIRIFDPSRRQVWDPPLRASGRLWKDAEARYK